MSNDPHVAHDPHETPTPLEVRHEEPIVPPNPPESHPDTPSAPMPGRRPGSTARTGDASPVPVPGTSPSAGGDAGSGADAGPRTVPKPPTASAPEPELPAGPDATFEPALPPGPDTEGDADPTEGGPLTRTAQQLAHRIAGIGGVASLAPGMKDLVASAAARVLRRSGGEPVGIDLSETEGGHRVRIAAHFDDSRSVAAIVDEIFAAVDREIGEPVEVDLRVLSRDSAH